MSQGKLKTALVQHACSSDVEANFQKSLESIAQAARQGARLVVLPELHRSLYFCQTENTDAFDLAETIPGPTTERLAEYARQHQLVIVSSLFEKRAAGLYHNTAVVFDVDGSMAGVYRKMHIPDDPGFYEKFYFAPGDLGFAPIQTSVGKLGVLVCWDQWFPEAARLMAMAGADILIYPTAIGWDPRDEQDEQIRQKEAWMLVQRGHAIANGLPLVAVNRVGHESDPSAQSEGIRFWGNSFACGPQGELLLQNDDQEEGIGMVDIDMARCEQVRRIWPFMRDRRIDAYFDLMRRYID